MRETTFEEDIELIRRESERISEGTMKPELKNGILHGEVRMSDGSLKKYQVGHRVQNHPTENKDADNLIEQPQLISRPVMRFNLGRQIDRHGNLPGSPSYQGSGQW